MSPRRPQYRFQLLYPVHWPDVAMQAEVSEGVLGDGGYPFARHSNVTQSDRQAYRLEKGRHSIGCRIGGLRIGCARFAHAERVGDAGLARRIVIPVEAHTRPVVME